MADPWNLTLDQSVFDDWNAESKIIIRGNDVTDTYNLVQKLDKDSVNQTDTTQLEHHLSICFQGDIDEKDLPPILQMVSVVSQKLMFLSSPMCQLTVQTCKQFLLQVLALDSSNDLKQYFECLGHCLVHIKGSKDSTSLITIFEIIEQTYSSCSNRTATVPDELFKHSSGMLMNALPVIEQQTFDDNSSVIKLLIPLIAIGKFSCKLDAKSMALIWKLVLKTMQQYPEICPELKLEAVVVFLIQEVFYLFEMLHQNPNNISKLAKVAGFLIKVIIGLIEKDAAMLENENVNEATLNLVFQLQKFTPDAVKYELSLSDDLVRLLELHVSITVHPILENLTKTRQLMSSLLKVSSNCPPENRLNFIRLLGLLLTPSYQLTMGENNETTSSDILAMFLLAVDKGHVEFNRAILLHGIVHSGKGIYTVPIYELLVTQATAAVAILPPHSVAQSVAILLQSVIKHGFWAHLISCDILSFMARYGSSQFCVELIQYLFLLSPSTPTPCSRSICLVNRLIPLLSDTGRAIILKSHPIEKYPDLWAAINWACFSSEQKADFQRYLLPSVNGPQLVKACTVLRLRSICTSGNCSILQERNEFLPNIIKLGTILLNGLNSKSAKEYHQHMEHLLVCVLRILLYTAQPSQKESHLNLMQILKLALDCKFSTPVQLDTAHFLSKIGASGVAGSPQQIALLRVIGNLFCETTASRSFLVQLLSLRAFEVFFKTTPHSHLASSCIREGQDFVVKQFINRKLTKPLIGEASLFYSTQLKCLTNPPCHVKSFPKLPIESYALLAADSLDHGAESYSNGSIAKRPRLDNADQLPFILNTLAKITADIGQLGPLPMWAKEEIRERINTVNSYL